MTTQMNRKIGKVMKVCVDIVLYSHKPYFLQEVIKYKAQERVLESKLDLLNRKISVMQQISMLAGVDLTAVKCI